MGASLHLNNKTDAIFNTSLGHEMCGPNGNDIAVQTGLWPPLNLRSIYRVNRSGRHQDLKTRLLLKRARTHSYLQSISTCPCQEWKQSDMSLCNTYQTNWTHKNKIYSANSKSKNFKSI